MCIYIYIYIYTYIYIYIYIYLRKVYCKPPEANKNIELLMMQK